MKIRTGFVSNSSSSSYVVFIPDDFDLDYSLYEEDDDTNVDTLKSMVKDLKNGQGIFQQDGYSEYYIIQEELRDKDLVVTSIETGPDDGYIDVITKEQITEIYNKYVGGTK